ncbi:molybdopterin cofactor-binding domain-containing protein [Pseudorhodoferax soli]|uniref:Nicotinate dehydrogenase subunit B n=1 Tax=Pseudorhodoferax soli TaxID=545864 RepID=A0A368XKQ8_9BURK|nr:molybdopterin cofactor-binding domain-containing protein [Pseudorhodoferax soli]RCW68562.1 nicotinate dehydrogenase subunit B [Pseudorhodoferax soli]
MTRTALRASSPLQRSDFLSARGVLVVVRETPPAPPPKRGQPPAVTGNPLEGDEVLLAVWNDGSISALNGHVDLGTGIQTALAQIVAEELDAPFDCVVMALGDTARAPNQGATIASATIQIHSKPLRLAAAQARTWLAERAGELLGAAPSEVSLSRGIARAGEREVPFAALVGDGTTVLKLDPQARTKAPQDYHLVGKSQPRVDIPAKLAGELVFVHDMRLPGMLHGRVVRPPYAGADHGPFVGSTLESVDEASVAHIPGLRAVVVIRDFVGVVADREEHAEEAAKTLAIRWKAWPGMPDLSSPDKVENAIRANPAKQRLLVDEGDIEACLESASQPVQRRYLWPYQMHASIGPSCAVAAWEPDERSRLRVWAGTQNPHVLRADLARLMALGELDVDVIRLEAAGCYGRNGADDVAADAALLSRAVGAPVRVQLTREQESQWEPKGAAQLMDVRGALSKAGRIAAYDFETSYPSNGAPTLALLLTGIVEPVAQSLEMGDRTARPPYDADSMRVKVNDMPPIVRASWLRGVSALPNSFAHESFVDELATQAKVDPVQFRLRQLADPRALDLIQATAAKAGWRMREGPQEASDGGLGEGGDILFGQGFAYARYMHSAWPGFGAAWAAWVADVEVNRKTGEVHVRRVVVGHDAGLTINPAGVEHQVHGNVVQATSRALKEEVRFAPGPGSAPTGERLPGTLPTGVVASREWGNYPILNFREVPVIEIVQMARPGEEPLGSGESASVPGTAAIANAIFDATGIRLREPPFTPEKVLAALNPLPAPTEQPAKPPLIEPARQIPPAAVLPKRKGVLALVTAAALGGIGVLLSLVGARPTIAPVSLSVPAYNAATIERGRVLAAAGDCAVCHTAADGHPNAGGRAMDTPFGKIYTTNLTPDKATGLGSWSFTAFQRAMREGISRDGRHLYPAFPYTAFAKTSDDDLQALFAYFMSLEPVAAQTPKSDLKFPFNVRSLLAGWNAMFHDPTPFEPDPKQTPDWNRGAYLVNGLGHCSACHTPRNALGAELTGAAFLSGAVIDGWEAPALTGVGKTAVPWDHDSLYQYLRNGHSPRHGVAGGPMAEVVRELQHLPDGDISAMATYLASFSPKVDNAVVLATRAVEQAAASKGQLLGAAQRRFDSACASCHHDGDGPKLLGVNTPLTLNSQLTSDRPDNLINTILNGVQHPATRDLGFMPAFKDAFDDVEIAELASYMRQRFAPQAKQWGSLQKTVGRLRSMHGAPE